MCRSFRSVISPPGVFTVKQDLEQSFVRLVTLRQHWKQPSPSCSFASLHVVHPDFQTTQHCCCGVYTALDRIIYVHMIRSLEQVRAAELVQLHSFTLVVTQQEIVQIRLCLHISSSINSADVKLRLTKVCGFSSALSYQKAEFSFCFIFSSSIVFFIQCCLRS